MFSFKTKFSFNFIINILKLDQLGASSSANILFASVKLSENDIDLQGHADNHPIILIL